MNVVTLGCSKNVYDSEVLMGQLKAGGKEVVHEQKGNIVVHVIARNGIEVFRFKIELYRISFCKRCVGRTFGFGIGFAQRFAE
ncbi:MAG: hypothetical protein ACFNOL_06600 [Treponema maltophilum]